MSKLPPDVPPPSRDEVREIAESYHMDLSDEDVDDYLELIEARMGVYERLDELTEPRNTPRATRRDPGYRPGQDEDPLNAIVTSCYVEGATEGPLAGYEVGVKDNVAVAGVEMTCGSKVLEGYVPVEDAAVVERLLEAGATITAKTNMDEMAVSGSGEMSATGPIFNPYDEDHLPGGSSGGSAAAVVSGTVDVAIGTDQAGSLRTPAAWSGCVGHKPTHGLVSFRGATAIGHSFDHIGPMATNVEDCARVLEVIAGTDPLDPRQKGAEEPEPGTFIDALTGDVDDVDIGVVREGFGHEHSETGVDEAVWAATEDLGDLGATVEEVSIPWHLDGFYVWVGVGNEEAAQMWESDGTGYFVDGHYDTHFRQAFGNARRARADDFAQTVKVKCIIGKYLSKRYAGHYHAKASNLRRELRAAYDDALESYDVLAMPTTPMTAFEYDPDVDSRQELDRRALGMDGRTRNTMPFDMTGHPSITVPCAVADGLPVGLMLVGRHDEDTTLLRVADAFERAFEWEEREVV